MPNLLEPPMEQKRAHNAKRFLAVLAALALLAIFAVKLFGGQVASKFHAANDDVAHSVVFTTRPSGGNESFRRENFPSEAALARNAARQPANPQHAAVLRARSGAPLAHHQPPTPTTPPPARLAL